MQQQLPTVQLNCQASIVSTSGSPLDCTSGIADGVCSGGTQDPGRKQCSMTASPAKRLTCKHPQRNIYTSAQLYLSQTEHAQSLYLSQTEHAQSLNTSTASLHRHIACHMQLLGTAACKATHNAGCSAVEQQAAKHKLCTACVWPSALHCICVPATCQTCHAHPRWRWLPRQLQAHVVGKVVAVELQQVVLVALVVVAHLLNEVLHLRCCQVRLAHVYTFPECCKSGKGAHAKGANHQCDPHRAGDVLGQT
jgi:hypothetical protein